jgi:hypothetical protein
MVWLLKTHIHNVPENSMLSTDKKYALISYFFQKKVTKRGIKQSLGLQVTWWIEKEDILVICCNIWVEITEF